MAGKFAVPTPLAETMLAGWLLSQGEIGFPGGRLSVAPVREKDRLGIDNNNTLTGTARSVPFAREADSFAWSRGVATRLSSLLWTRPHVRLPMD